jgi:sporulation protein YlmC with PRC-barrel domain
MSNRLTSAAFAAAMLAASPLALAQSTAQTSAMTPTADAPATRIEAGQIRGTDLRGSSVYDSQNKKIGSVDDMILDHNGRVAAVVIGVKDKDVAVGMRDLKFAMSDNNGLKQVTIDKSWNELESATPFDLKTNTSPTSHANPANNR